MKTATERMEETTRKRPRALERKTYPAADTMNSRAQNIVQWRGSSLAASAFLAFSRGTPGFPGKRRIYDWLGSFALRRCLYLTAETGVRIRVDPTDYIGRMLAMEGSYEPHSLRLARRLASRGGNFVDVGCNFGMYSLWLSDLKGLRPICIDASFLALSRLRDNLLLNPAVAVEIVHSALSDRGGLHCLELPEARNLGTTRIVDGESADGSFRYWASGLTLQEILDRMKCDSVQLLKIDVEGHELKVLKGLDLEGRGRPSHMLVETDPDFPQCQECFEYIQDKGYEPLTIHGDPVSSLRELPEHNVWFRAREASAN